MSERLAVLPSKARSGPLVSQALYDVNWKQIMPRLGIVYRLNDRTVLRMGSGLFYSPQQTNNFNILGLNPPFSGSTVFQNDRNNPTATIQNPFAGSPVGGGPAAIVMLGWTKADRDNRSMYLNNKIWQWTTEIERSFGQNFVPVSPMSEAPGRTSICRYRTGTIPTPALARCRTGGPTRSMWTPARRIRCFRSGRYAGWSPGRNSNYHAVQARAEKHYSRGLTFNASFNFQKAMYIGYGVNEGGPYGNSYTQDPRDRLADYGRSQIDQRFRFVFPISGKSPGFVMTKASRAGCLAAGRSTGHSTHVGAAGNESSRMAIRRIPDLPRSSGPMSSPDTRLGGFGMTAVWIIGSTQRIRALQVRWMRRGRRLHGPQGIWKCRGLSLRCSGAEDVGLRLLQGIRLQESIESSFVSKRSIS